MGTLYLVATPIGNLEDITLRALSTLAEVDLIAAEDTRRTRILLQHHGIRTPTLSYHEHNKRQQLDRLLQSLASGSVALVSDAGTPGLSDPGYELVRQALAAGHQVSPIPGPAAPIAALVASGLPSDQFVFLGYLPRKSAERRGALRALAAEQRTMVFFETPHRLVTALEDLTAAFGPDRSAALCRELTKLHEEILRGTLEEISSSVVSATPRGEITLVIAGATQQARWGSEQVRQAIAARLQEGLRPSQAAREVAEQSGWPRSEVYRLAVEER